MNGEAKQQNTSLEICQEYKFALLELLKQLEYESIEKQLNGPITSL